MKPYKHKHKHKHILRTALCVAALLGATGSLRAAIVASIAGDYVDTTTMPLGWQYYVSDAANGGTEQLMSGGQSVGSKGAFGFSTANGGNVAAIIGEGNPFQIWNGNNSPIAGTDLLVQNGTERYVLLRYTISAQDISNGTSGTLSGSFRNNFTGGDGVSVGIYHNNSLLWSVNSMDSGDSSLTQIEGSYNIIVGTQFAAGDTITFYIDSNGSNIGDESAINGTLNLVPEPATYALIFGGLAIGFVMLHRRLKA